MMVDIRRLTVAEYHPMGELKILDPNEPVELIERQIIKKPMKGKAQSAAVSRVDNLLINLLANRVLVRLQYPIHLNDYSEPEPDITLVKTDRGEINSLCPLCLCGKKITAIAKL